MTIRLTRKQQAADWDRVFTFRIWQLQPADAEKRVAAAWLAGYNACLKNARDRRTTNDRAGKQ